MAAYKMHDEVDSGLAKMPEGEEKLNLVNLVALISVVRNDPEGLARIVKYDEVKVELLDDLRNRIMNAGYDRDTNDWKRSECMEILNDAKLDKAVSANLFIKQQVPEPQ